MQISIAQCNWIDENGNYLFNENVEFVFSETLEYRTKKYLELCGKLCGKLVILSVKNKSFPQCNLTKIVKKQPHKKR